MLSQVIVDGNTFKVTKLFSGRISSWMRDTAIIQVENDEFYYLDGNDNSIVKQSLSSEKKSILTFTAE